jgi:hypothetical protein
MLVSYGGEFGNVEQWSEKLSKVCPEGDHLPIRSLFAESA